MLTQFLVTCFLILVANSKKPYNVLFIVVDDLRTELGGPYGQSDLIYTPNLEAIMDRAFTFTHAYTQIAICAATRASFLTGTRPDTTRIWYDKKGPFSIISMITDYINENVYFIIQEYWTIFQGYNDKWHWKNSNYITSIFQRLCKLLYSWCR